MSSDAESATPAWRRHTEGERRWWSAIAILGAIVLQSLVPDRFVIHPRYVAQVVELVGLVGVVVAHPDRLSRRTPSMRAASQLLLGLIAATNIASVVLLVHEITTGGHIPPLQLLIGGGEIWLTNTTVFALWYWEYDRGGPANRAHGSVHAPDLLFPQMTDDRLGHNWEPNFLDYFFVSFTNSTAFSPTDTMPLSRWAKVLFMVQSALSLITVALIAARAVNILPNG